MKKILTLLVAIMATATVAHAQFGIIGGWTTSQLNTKDLKENFKGLDNFHAGIAYHAKLPLGFAIQPELTYEMKGARIEKVEHVAEYLSSTKSHNVELGLGVQWGIDLLIARPFVVAEPFLGYCFTANPQFTKGVTQQDISSINDALNAAANKLEGGIALGAGIDIVRHIQVSVKWYKNIGNLFDEGKLRQNLKEDVVNAVTGIKSYSGVKITLGIFF